MNNIKCNQLIFIGMILFLASMKLSGQPANDKKEIRKISKYKYILPETSLNDVDSTRNLKPEDLELIEYFDKNGKRIKTEKYRNGKLMATEVLDKNIESEQPGSGIVRDTIQEGNGYDSKSMYGAVMQLADDLGLEKGQPKEKYEATYTANGDLMAEYIMNPEGDTLRSFKYYYDDSNILLRTEEYEKGNIHSTRVYLGGGVTEHWNRIILFGKTGEIRSDEWTKFSKISPYITKSTTVFKWGGEEGGQSIRNAIFFMDGEGNTNKAVYEVNDEILVIEYKREVISNP